MRMNLNLILTGALIVFLLGTGITTVLPLADASLIEPSARARPYTDLELRGRLVYQREGCWYCHTQYVRDRPADQTQNFGPVSVSGDYVYRQPAVMGSERTGPDLMWVADRQPSRDWHLLHLYDPQATSPGSIMPRFTWLFTGQKDERGIPIPNEDGEALVAYLLSLTSRPPTPTPKPGEPTPTPAPVATPPPASDLGGGNVDNGKNLFAKQACSACHVIEAGKPATVGPNLSNIGNRAAARKPGYAAEQYIWESILNPNAYVAPGFNAGVMPQDFRQKLSDQDLKDLIAYLLTLKSGQD
jgi:cytochrome c oxidase cbb3-type subunit 2